MIGYVYDDGGRRAAGFTGDAGDCVVRAIAIATQTDYRLVYDLVNSLAREERPRTRSRSSARDGVWRATYDKILIEMGWTWTPTMGIGTGCTVHLRADELPPGRLAVKLSRHMTAVVDGVVHDTYDPRRDGRRCVYGIWSKP
jgi:hypothetical protein